MIGHWSKVQGKIAPSSGEAELMAANLGLSSLAGTVQLQLELNQDDVTAYKRKHPIDANACKGMLLRRGVGAIKHLEVRDLWGQEIVRRLGVLVTKIPREVNSADALASVCGPQDLADHLNRMGLDFDTVPAHECLMMIALSLLGAPLSNREPEHRCPV